MRRIEVIGVVALGLAGCTHRQQLPASGEGLEVGDRVAARTADGAALEGTIVKGPLGGYRVRIDRPRRELELTEVTTISRESRGRGAVDGLIIGAIAGAVFGAVVGAVTWEEPGYLVDSPEAAFLLSTAAWAGIGGLVGSIGGAVGAATYEYAVPASP